MKVENELPHQPFERQIVGFQGATLLRRNPALIKESCKAIQRRSHPAWSQLLCSFQVEQPRRALNI